MAEWRWWEHAAAHTAAQLSGAGGSTQPLTQPRRPAEHTGKANLEIPVAPKRCMQAEQYPGRGQGATSRDESDDSTPRPLCAPTLRCRTKRQMVPARAGGSTHRPACADTVADGAASALHAHVVYQSPKRKTMPAQASDIPWTQHLRSDVEQGVISKRTACPSDPPAPRLDNIGHRAAEAATPDAQR